MLSATSFTKLFRMKEYIKIMGKSETRMVGNLMCLCAIISLIKQKVNGKNLSKYIKKLCCYKFTNHNHPSNGWFAPTSKSGSYWLTSQEVPMVSTALLFQAAALVRLSFLLPFSSYYPWTGLCILWMLFDRVCNLLPVDFLYTLRLLAYFFLLYLHNILDTKNFLKILQFVCW